MKYSWFDLSSCQSVIFVLPITISFNICDLKKLHFYAVPGNIKTFLLLIYDTFMIAPLWKIKYLKAFFARISHFVSFSDHEQKLVRKWKIIAKRKNEQTTAFKSPKKVNGFFVILTPFFGPPPKKTEMKNMAAKWRN